VPPNALAEGLRLQAYVNLAHGSHGHLYFEWRRPLRGNEQYRPSFIKGFDGAVNPAKPVFEQIGREFKHVGPRLAGATTRADVVLLYDFTNSWGQGYGFAGNSNAHYDGEAYRYYNGFKVLQRNIDIVPLSADLTPYKLVVAPNLRLVSDSAVQRLQAFVAAGGILVLNFRAGTQNIDGSMRRMIPPGVFTEMAGVVAESKLDLIEYGGLAEQLAKDPETALGIDFPGNNTIFDPRTILESLLLHGAEPVAGFRGGRMTGKPAITRHRYKQGWVFYVGTDSAEDGFYEALARVVGATTNLSPLIAAPYGVEVTSREDAETIFYFLLNLTEATHNEIQLPRPMDDLIGGQKRVTKISLGPLEVAVLASPKIPI
jgi:beta-galactosidase